MPRHHPGGLTLADWIAIAAITSAASTIILAVLTVWLAKRTSDAAGSADRSAAAAEEQLEAAKAQTEAAEEALKASIRPLIADVPRHTMQPVSLTTDERLIYRNKRELQPGHREVDVSRIVSSFDVVPIGGGEDEVYLTVPMRNIGAGVALVVGVRLARSRDDLRGEPAANGEMVSSVVASGQVVRVTFQHHEPQPGWLAELLRPGNQALVVEVAYTDVSAREPTASRLYLGPRPDDDDLSYVVAQVRPLVERQLTADVTWDPRA